MEHSQSSAWRENFNFKRRRLTINDLSFYSKKVDKEKQMKGKKIKTRTEINEIETKNLFFEVIGEIDKSLTWFQEAKHIN